MQFINSTINNNNYFKYVNQAQKMNQPGAYLMQIPRRAEPIQIAIAPEPIIKLKHMKWGEPTWFLFHTLAHKIKDEYFAQAKLSILSTISMICSNLPCPDCSKHATEYMKNINYNSIKTKQDLKNMLFQFHNVVNQRKGFAIFSIDDLDSKYSTANTINIIQNFMFYFQDKHFSIRMIANDMHRSKIITILKTWFNDNMKYFDS